MHGALALDGAWLLAVFLLSLRLAAVFLMTPVLAEASVPRLVRALFVLGLAAALSLGLPGAALAPGAHDAALDAPGPLLQAAFTELALGATLALGVMLAFAAVTMAGQLLGIQMGLGLGQVFDPVTNRNAPLLGKALNQLAVLVFFLSNGHHALLRGVAYSLERFPLGQPWPLEAAAGPLLQQVGGLLGLGFALAAPVVVSMLLVDLALGVVARSMPQMNMIAMGVPVKIVVGLVALSLWFAGAGDVLDRVYASIYRCWDAVFAAAPSAPSRGLAALLLPQGVA